MADGPTLEELAQFVDLEQERLELGRRVDEIERLQKPIKQAALSFVKKTGKPSRTRGDFTIEHTLSSANPPWKDFALCLAQKHDAMKEVEKFRKKVPKREGVKITRREKTKAKDSAQ